MYDFNSSKPVTERVAPDWLAIHFDEFSGPKTTFSFGFRGLARLLKLLTNYLKVEIGHKLHFRIVADPQLVQHLSRFVNCACCLVSLFHSQIFHYLSDEFL